MLERRYRPPWFDWLGFILAVTVGCTLAVVIVAGAYGVVTAYREPAQVLTPRDLRAEHFEAKQELWMDRISHCGTAGEPIDLVTEALMIIAPYGEERYSLATMARLADERAAEWCKGRSQ